jgi:predicted HTH transcriptional regulator
MPQDAAFCAVSCGSVLSRAFQNEIHRSAKRGKMRQIEAAKSSRKVVKRDFLLLGFLLPFAPKQIINLLSENGELGRAKIVEEIKQSDRTVSRKLSHLVEMGIIVVNGNKYDKNHTYSLK